MIPNNQREGPKQKQQKSENGMQTPTARRAEWIPMVLSFGVAIVALYVAGKSLSISETALRLSLIEKKPTFSYLIRYDKHEDEYFFHVKNLSTNKARLLSVRLLPKIYNKEKMTVREGKPISLIITDKTFTKDTDHERLIENFYETNQIRRDSEQLWIEGAIRYYNLETEEWQSHRISDVEIKGG